MNQREEGVTRKQSGYCLLLNTNGTRRGLEKLFAKIIMWMWTSLTL